jgi:hypothetical protein
LLVDDALEFELRGKAGARFHRLLQQYLLGIPEARLSEIAASDPNPEILLWWKNFLAFIPHLLDGEKFVEISLSAQMRGYPLVAKYDLILVQDGSQLVIFDWKTAGQRPRKDWLIERVQTRLYRYLLTTAGGNLLGNSPVHPEQVMMNYWFAPHPEAIISLKYNQKAFEEDRAFLENCILEISNRKEKDFFRTEDINKCRYCVYRSHCDRGVTAGDLEDFEAFEMEAEDFEPELDFDEIEEIKF